MNAEQRMSKLRAKHDAEVFALMFEDPDYTRSAEEVVAGIEGRAWSRASLSRERKFIGECV